VTALVVYLSAYRARRARRAAIRTDVRSSLLIAIDAEIATLEEGLSLSRQRRDALPAGSPARVTAEVEVVMGQANLQGLSRARARLVAKEGEGRG
jgi:hypothetical protein